LGQPIVPVSKCESTGQRRCKGTINISDEIESSTGLTILLVNAVPYPDRRRRRAARRAAGELIDCSPWPGDEARPIEIAQLALLRLLYLQREAHRCTSQQREAITLLARAAVETAITGLYWLYGEQGIEPARSDNAKSFRRLWLRLPTARRLARK